jgi:murein DD-endopeptidase MepM/ murein hydrolase activator NlpD
VRGALALVVVAAGLLLGGLLVAPSGAEPTARARATAMVAAVGPDRYGEARSTSPGERWGEGSLDIPGVSLEGGEALARTSRAGTAKAWAGARSVSLLGDRVTADRVRRDAVADADGVQRSGAVTALKVDGREIGEVTQEATFDLDGGDGTVIVNRGTIGLRVVLAKEVGGMPAGTELRVAFATASVAAPAPAATPPRQPKSAKGGAKGKGKAKAKPRRDVKAGDGKLVRRRAPRIPRRLTAAGFAFPVFGNASVADDFGAARATTGTHVGNDIFAEFGAPVVAVADGVLSKVGTLTISGNRLWLTTDSGDAFFYAHMSAFSPEAVDGARVTAGTVLGFVGNTGDAENTPPHLHFEIHPGGEERPAIDPHGILTAWQGRRDVAPAAWLQAAGTDTAERPGALVAVRDFIAE